MNTKIRHTVIYYLSSNCWGDKLHEILRQFFPLLPRPLAARLSPVHMPALPRTPARFYSSPFLLFPPLPVEVKARWGGANVVRRGDCGATKTAQEEGLLRLNRCAAKSFTPQLGFLKHGGQNPKTLSRTSPSFRGQLPKGVWTLFPITLKTINTKNNCKCSVEFRLIITCARLRAK